MAVHTIWLRSFFCKGSTSIGVVLWRGMAHYPRWISSFNVDSEAMLGAYMNALVKQEEAISTMRCAGELTIVEHEGIGKVIPLQGTKEVLCPNGDSGCRRCLQKCGGYVFKWYSPIWHEDYVTAVKKKQAAVPIWVPGADESLWSMRSFDICPMRSGMSMRRFLLWHSVRCDSYGYHIPPGPEEEGYEDWRRLCSQTAADAATGPLDGEYLWTRAEYQSAGTLHAHGLV